MLARTIARLDVTGEDVARALRRELGPGYNVLPATRRNWNPFYDPPPGGPDTVLVGIGGNRVFRVEVRLSRRGGWTWLHVKPGGFGGPLRLTNVLWLGRRVCRALQRTPDLG